MFRKILIPIDLDEPKTSETVIRRTLEFAKIFDADLRLVYVQSPDLVALSDYGLVDPGDRLRLKAEAEMLKLIKSIEYAKERFSAIAHFGGISPKILAEADEWPADLIALGSHLPSIATYLLGSNAVSIVRHAKCSVLILRESGQAALRNTGGEVASDPTP